MIYINIIENVSGETELGTCENKKKMLIKYKEMNFLALQLLGQQEISGASVQN